MGGCWCCHRFVSSWNHLFCLEAANSLLLKTSNCCVVTERICLCISNLNWNFALHSMLVRYSLQGNICKFIGILLQLLATSLSGVLLIWSQCNAICWHWCVTLCCDLDLRFIWSTKHCCNIKTNHDFMFYRTKFGSFCSFIIIASVNWVCMHTLRKFCAGGFFCGGRKLKTSRFVHVETVLFILQGKFLYIYCLLLTFEITFSLETIYTNWPNRTKTFAVCCINWQTRLPNVNNVHWTSLFCLPPCDITNPWTHIIFIT